MVTLKNWQGGSSKRKSGSLFSLFSSASPIPSSALAARLCTFSTAATALLRCRDQDCTQCSRVGASVGKKRHPLSYSHYPSWLWTVFLIMGNISVALLPATAHRAGDFRDLSVTTPEPQPPLPSLEQRQHPGYLPYGHHRTQNLVCHLSTHSILWATFGDVCHWHSIWPSKGASYHPKPWKSTARCPLSVHWWRCRFPQEKNTRMPWPACSSHFAVLDVLSMNASNRFSNPCKLLTARGNHGNDFQSCTLPCMKKHLRPFACFEPSPNNFIELG